MTKLSVNVNKIALLRNSRGTGAPSVTDTAQVCVDTGAHGITVHPRPDGRHIRRHDVFELSEMLSVEFNIEGNPTPDFLDLVCEVKPDQCTLVPDLPGALTSDHGWDLDVHGGSLPPVIQRLQAEGIRVSLFMDPDPEQTPRAKDLGADRIELYTESYARAHGTGECARTLDRFVQAARRAIDAGLGVNAGHDLNQQNLEEFCLAVPKVEEVSIGHALIVDALSVGLIESVRAYLTVLKNASNG